MRLQEIQQIAKNKGVHSIGTKKEDVIRAIQRAEHYNDCYATAFSSSCNQPQCLWREDCVAADHAAALASEKASLAPRTRISEKDVTTH